MFKSGSKYYLDSIEINLPEYEILDVKLLNECKEVIKAKRNCNSYGRPKNQLFIKMISYMESKDTMLNLIGSSDYVVDFTIMQLDEFLVSSGLEEVNHKGNGGLILDGVLVDISDWDNLLEGRIKPLINNKITVYLYGYRDKKSKEWIGVFSESIFKKFRINKKSDYELILEEVCTSSFIDHD